MTTHSWEGQSLNVTGRLTRCRTPKGVVLIAVLALMGLTVAAPSVLANEPPTIQVDFSPKPNSSGWHNTDVTVTWTISDPNNDDFETFQDCPTSGSQSTEVTVEKQLTNETSGKTLTCQAEDVNGNNRSETVIVKIDSTPPDVNSNQDPSDNPHGWNTSDVEVKWNVNDDIAGIASLDGCGNNFRSKETRETTFECTATDAAGNSRTATHTVKIDKTRPVIQSETVPELNEFGWQNEPVKIRFTDCSDTGSVQSQVEKNDPFNISVDQVATNDKTLTDEGADQVVTSPGSDCIDKAGNQALDESVTVNIDKTKPAVIKDETIPTPNDNGWWSTQVEFRFSCEEQGSVESGIDENTVADKFFADNEINSFDKPESGEKCNDRAGNSAEQKTFTVRIDKRRPVIESTVTPEDNDDGWHNQDVTVEFDCSDKGPAGFGIDPKNNPVAAKDMPTKVFTQEGEGLSVSSDFEGDDCVDLAGNQALVETVTGINIDKTRPQISYGLDPTPNVNDWHNSPVDVNFRCDDVLRGGIRSGIDVDSVGTKTLSSEGKNQSVKSSGNCEDVAGNSADTAEATGINIDKTNPEITAGLTSGGNPYTPGDWTNQDVDVAFECADAGNVQSGTSPESVEDTVTVNDVVQDDQTITDEGENQSVASQGRNCIDSAGNAATTKTVDGINIDKTDPGITATLTSGGNPYTPGDWTNQDVVIDFECGDVGPAQSDIATDNVNDVTVSDEGRGQSVTSSGVCKDKAGNKADAVTIRNINIDKTDPDIIAEQEPEPNPNGWNLSDVAVTFDCVEQGAPQSGNDPDETTLDGDTIVSSEGSTTVDSIGSCQDRAGNTADQESVTVKIDKTPPSVAITDNPPEITDDPDANFRFNATDAPSGIADVECRLDDADFTACTSQTSESFTGLSQGEHTFEVRAVDVAGNTSSVTSFTWTVIPSPSEFTVEIADGPAEGSFTRNTVARFVFSVNIDAPVDLETECRLDSGPFEDCTSPFTLRNLGEGKHTFEVRAVTPTGQRSNPVARTWNIDRTSPVLSVDVSPDPNANGWHDSDVTVSFSCSDPTSNGVSAGVETIISGEASTSGGTLDVTVSEEGEGLSRTGTCDDGVGNRSTETASDINIDKTLTEIVGDRSPRANANGWNKTDVTVRFDCVNPGPSRIVTDTVKGDTVSAEGKDQSVTSEGACVDAADNEATPTTVTGINIDRTSPEISSTRDPEPNENGWNNQPVTVAFQCFDTGEVQSGIANDTVSRETTLAAEGEDQTVTSEGVCVDQAGNTTDREAISVTVNIDLTPPSITLATPADGAQFEQNSAVAANFLTEDGLSGIATINSTEPNGTNIDTATLGEREFTVTAVDRADNSHTVTHTYQVLLLPPDLQDQLLDEIRSSLQEQINEAVTDPEFERGDAIELCLTFEDPRTGERISNAQFDPELFRVPEAGDPVSMRELAPFTYDEDREAYCLTFETTNADGDPLPPGEYQLVVALNDGTGVRINFALS